MIYDKTWLGGEWLGGAWLGKARCGITKSYYMYGL